MRAESQAPDMRGWSKDRRDYWKEGQRIQAEMKAHFAAMTDADFEFIATTVGTLRNRYPALQIEIGYYGQDDDTW